MAAILRHRSALLIACLFLVLGMVYSISSPVFEPGDEHNHYAFVQHLATGANAAWLRRLPVQVAGEKTLWGQEGSQPPLYYAVAALLTAGIDTGDMPSLMVANPHAQSGVPGTPDNANQFIHYRQEPFPWRGTALAVHLIRLFSVLLGVGTLLCTYALALFVLPGRPAIAVGAMAINAFIPMFIFTSASVNNDSLVIFLSSLSLVLLVRAIQRGAPPGLLLALGGVTGLACLTKLSALGLLPLACLGLALAAQRRGVAGRPGVIRWAGQCALVIIPASIIAGWWYFRNWQLYGDLLGLNTMVAVAGGRPPREVLSDLLGEFQGFRYSFWGVLGGFNILLRPAWVYAVLDLVCAVAAVGLVLPACQARRRRTSGPPALELWLLAAWTVIEAVALLRWTSMTLASQGRLMFAALAPICLFLALGLIGPLAPRHQWVAARVIGGLLFLLAAVTPFAAIRPAYEPQPLLAVADVPTSARRYEVDFGGVMRLLAWEAGARVTPGASLPVTLYWQALAPVDEDLSVSVQLFSWQQALGQHDSYPGGGLWPTSRLVPGQVVRDTHLIPVRRDAKGPTPGWISISLYRFSTMEKLSATDAQGQPVVFPILTRIALDPAEPAPTLAGAHPLDASFGSRVRLTGYDLASSLVRAGEEVTVTLYWQTIADMDVNYSTFIHLRDAGTGEPACSPCRTAAQVDAELLQGFYPTSAWQPGEVFGDTQHLSLPQDLPAGTYRIFAGLYDAMTGQRLPVLNAGGEPIGNELPIATVEVAD